MIKLTELDLMPTTAPYPFDGEAIDHAALEAFIKVTIGQNKKSIIIFGANWCPDALHLEAVMQLPTISKFIQANFEVMRVDLGKYDLNMTAIELFGIPSTEGIPRVFILDLLGNPMNRDSNDKWRSARDSNAQEIFNYFQYFSTLN